MYIIRQLANYMGYEMIICVQRFLLGLGKGPIRRKGISFPKYLNYFQPLVKRIDNGMCNGQINKIHLH